MRRLHATGGRMPSFPSAPWIEQRASWPDEGRHVLACFDADTVVVWQAYLPSIGDAAVADGRFGGGGWSFGRMSWVKPNFLWMMYRSAWGTAEGQERVLAVRVRRTAFDGWLGQAVGSSFRPGAHADRAAWQAAVRGSDVRLQWDPDHDPHGRPLARRALQLGLRGAALAVYASDAIVAIEDASAFVAEQRAHVRGRALDALSVPVEACYPLAASLRERLSAS